MRIEKQLSVFLVNKPGRLANVCSALAHEKVNILADIDGFLVLSNKDLNLF